MNKYEKYYHRKMQQREDDAIYRQIQHDRKEFIKRENQRLREREQTVGRIRYNTRSQFGGVVRRFGSRFVTGISTGNVLTSILCFIVVFCLLSQVFFNTQINWSTNKFTYYTEIDGVQTLVEDNVFDSNGFFTDSAIENIISPYTLFESKLTILDNFTDYDNSIIFWALSNYSTILDNMTTRNSHGQLVLKYFVNAYDNGDIEFYTGIFGFIEAFIERIADILTALWGFICLIGNTFLLLVAFLYTGFMYLTMILSLIGLI